MDWNEIRRTGTSGVRPDEWPEDVYAISMEGLALLGIHSKKRKLFWDGNEIVTRSVVRLGKYELGLAAIASVSTFGMFVLSLGAAVGWWN